MIRQISMQREIAAPPAAIYPFIADYRDGHRRIVSPRAFLWLDVVKGGTGAGTEISMGMKAFGMTTVLHGVVSEPEPGRLLVERYPANGNVTSFLVDPVKGGTAAMVTIATDMNVWRGPVGLVQGALFERYLQPLYVEELQRLADLAEGRHRHDPIPAKRGV